MKLHQLCLPCLAALALACAPAWAKLQEEQFDLPVAVQDGYGKRVEQSIRVTVFSDDTNPQPAPVLVLNHGRAAEAQDRAAMGRARYTDVSTFLVGRGFIVAVPTRVGYGASGGEDVEDTGPCTRKNYAPGFAAAARQTQAVLDAVRRRPDADAGRGIVMGQSFGGGTAVAVAALNLPGVQGAINFAGGNGGNPKTQPQRPCAPQLLERIFRGYGEVARTPTLWIYTENDMYFGPTYPKQWFGAFSAGGAPAQFVQFPPHGDDGHALFTRFPQVWQPRVTEFLESLGFPAPPRRSP